MTEPLKSKERQQSYEQSRGNKGNDNIKYASSLRKRIRRQKHTGKKHTGETQEKARMPNTGITHKNMG